MKVKVILTGIVMMLLCNVCYASAYKVDNASIDAVVANAVEIATLETSSAHGFHGANAMFSSNKSGWAAWVICWFVGPIGIHRHYLGTKSSMWAIYTFTCCGIFGIVPTVDWVVLLIGAIQNDISKYTGNTNFFMWAN